MIITADCALPDGDVMVMVERVINGSNTVDDIRSNYNNRSSKNKYLIVSDRAKSSLSGNSLAAPFYTTTDSKNFAFKFCLCNRSNQTGGRPY